MPFVTLVYGPYEANGIIRHRPQRLHGLLECLTNKGYEVELIESEHLNRLTVEMKERTIFQCDIKNLLFNMSCEDDVICQRVLGAIEEAEARFYSDTNVPKFVSVKEGKRYLRLMDDLKSKDLFDSDVSLLFEIGLRKKHDEESKGEQPGEEKDAEKLAVDKPELKEHTATEEVMSIIDEMLREKLDDKPPGFYEFPDMLPEDIELYADELEMLLPTMPELIYKDDVADYLQSITEMLKFLYEVEEGEKETDEICSVVGTTEEGDTHEITDDLSEAKVDVVDGRTDEMGEEPATALQTEENIENSSATKEELAPTDEITPDTA